MPDHYSSVTRDLATSYFHWFFLIQLAPFPEQLVAGNPRVFLRRFLPASTIAPESFAECLRCFRDPMTIHAACEDYRAGATIDLIHAQETKSSRIKCLLLVLLGERGAIAQLYKVAKVWREQASSSVQGKALPTAHHLAEEAPEQTRREILVPAVLRYERMLLLQISLRREYRPYLCLIAPCRVLVRACIFSRRLSLMT